MIVDMGSQQGVPRYVTAERESVHRYDFRCVHD